MKKSIYINILQHRHYLDHLILCLKMYHKFCIHLMLMMHRSNMMHDMMDMQDLSSHHTSKLDSYTFLLLSQTFCNSYHMSSIYHLMYLHCMSDKCNDKLHSHSILRLIQQHILELDIHKHHWSKSSDWQYHKKNRLQILLRMNKSNILLSSFDIDLYLSLHRMLIYRHINQDHNCWGHWIICSMLSHMFYNQSMLLMHKSDMSSDKKDKPSWSGHHTFWQDSCILMSMSPVLCNWSHKKDTCRSSNQHCKFCK